MLRIKQSKNASYYTNEHGEKENYYDKESKGFWIGSAKEHLKLNDELKIDEYNKLFNGQGIEGKQLTYKTGQNRTYDLTLSCNKDISILKAAYPEHADTFDKITFDAVEKTLDFAQQFIAVRQTKNGVTTKNYETSSVFGVFHHSTSRELDPQEHYHCLLMPVSFNEKGKAFANDVKKLFEEQKTIGLFFQKEIAKGLEDRLNLKTKFNEKGLSSILGISKEERDYFSKRKAQIEKLAGPNASYEEKDKASLKSRLKKTDYNLDKLKDGWNKELKEKFGFNSDRLQAMQSMEKPKQTDLSLNKTVSAGQKQMSFFKNISKMTKVQPAKKSEASKEVDKKSLVSKLLNTIGAAATREALLSSIHSMQTSLNMLQSQLSAMPQNDPNRLQLFASFISMGFQLSALQIKLGEFEAKELQKKIDEMNDKQKDDKEDGKQNTPQNSRMPTRTNTPPPPTAGK